MAKNLSLNFFLFFTRNEVGIWSDSYHSTWNVWGRVKYWRDLPTRFACRQGGCGSRKRIDKAERLDFAKADSLEQIEAHKASCDQLNKHFFTKYLT